MNGRKLTLNLIIFALMSLTIFTSQTSAQRNGKIAFASNIGNNYEIFTVNPDGSDRTRLTHSGNSNRPAFSPDGGKIAFHRSDGIYLMNADGSNQTLLTSRAGCIEISWSPDSRKLVLACGGIYVINADGRNLTQISANLNDSAPAWSPDGTKIAFTRNLGSLNCDIFVMNVDGSNPVRLTNDPLPDFGAVWSPDGARLAFTRYDDCFDIGNGEVICFFAGINLMNADGSNQTFLTGGSIFDTYAEIPAWSPDGTKIAFQGYRHDSKYTELFVINTDGGNWTNLSDTVNSHELVPSWGAVPLSAPNRAAFDFDGDGRSDISVFRPSDATWYLNQSTAGFSAAQFGVLTDKITPADFDGDGKTDIAVFRDGAWFWLDSSNGNFNSAQFGLAGDLPVPADYTGDGRAELAVYRGGTWWSFDPSVGQTRNLQFGIDGDKPVAADYDGDGIADQAVFRNGEWHLNRSSQGYAVAQFGLATDKTTNGDYDGDGKADIAVFRDGNWYLLQSAQGFAAIQFGIASDAPVPADYDGDERTDVAVFRNGNWYVLQSSNGQLAVHQFGNSGDVPVNGVNVQ